MYGLIRQRSASIAWMAVALRLDSDGGYIASNEVVHGWVLNCMQAVSNFPGPAPKIP